MADGRVSEDSLDGTTRAHLERERVHFDLAERAARFGYWRLDLATNKTYWSPGMYRLLDVDPVEQIPDVLQDPEFDFPGVTQISGNRAVLGVPLLRDGRVEGVFALGRNAPGFFTSDQMTCR